MYYEAQADTCIAAEVPTIVMENVEEVVQPHPNHPVYGLISPVDALKKRLQGKYEVEVEIVDSARLGGRVSRPRAIVQCKLKAMYEGCSLAEHKHEVEERLARIWEQQCNKEPDIACKWRTEVPRDRDWRRHFRVSELGFIWPLPSSAIHPSQYLHNVLDKQPHYSVQLPIRRCG